MKRKVIFLLFLVSILTLSGCVGKDSTGTNSNSSNTNNNSSQKEIVFEQPEERADVMGIVDSISGNEVVVLKMEIQNPGQERGMMPEGMELEEGINENEDENNKTLSLSGTATGGRMPMGGGPGGGPRGEMDEDAQSEMLERIKSMSSGSETVIIPVGIQMLKMDTDSREMVEADLTDIENNQMLSIWLNKEISDRNIAEFVLIR